MKKIIFFLSLSLCTLAISAQQIETMSVVTTPRGEKSPLSMLSPGYEFHKFTIQNPSRETFNINFHLEKFAQDNSSESEKIASFNTSDSKFLFELIPDRKENESLFLLIYTPGQANGRYVFPNDNNRLKWVILTNTSSEIKTPILLIYEEEKDDNSIEKKITKLFQNLSEKNIIEEKTIIEKIKPFVDSFYLLSYEI